MKKYRIPLILFAICFYFVIYLTSTIFQSQLLGNILSPIGALLSSGIIFIFFNKFNEDKSIKIVWFLLCLGCFSWTIADILWAYYDMALKINPSLSNLITAFYAGTNLFFLIALVIYAIRDFRKWNAILLVVNSIFLSIVTLYFLWIVFLNKNVNMINIISNSNWVTTFTIILDVSALIGITIWYCSMNFRKIPLFQYITSFSTIIFFTVDLYWYYLYINKIYIPNSVIDAFYMLSFLGLAVGACLRSITVIQNKPLNVKYSKKSIRNTSLYLIFCLIATIIFKGFRLNDVVNFGFIFIIYVSLSIYILSAIKEHNVNLELEKRINERTRELIEKNRMLDILSKQDSVTNLYNRRYFVQKLETELVKTASNETLALIFIDLDRFKTINDIYGHDVGDLVLIEIAKRLQITEHKDAFIARFGGDEFCLAFHSNYGYQEMEEIARQIIDNCNKIIKIGLYSFKLTISVGISIYPLDAGDTTILLKNADMAMYQAKKKGYNKFVSFNKQLSTIIKRKNEIEVALSQVNYDKEFTLFYQPQYNMQKELIGMEALLRWNSPKIGSIPPAEFIPIAEETDHIVPIGSWVMKKAIEQIVKWNQRFKSEFRMSINVSPKQLEQTGFFQELQACISSCVAKPEWVDIEITEGISVEGAYRMTEISNQLKNAGISISIDDFGTGYSSLSYLKLVPFDRLKIAKPLIDSITTENFDQHITEFIIALAKSLGIKTIAEGVESQKQFDLLFELGCEQIQGYLLGKPKSPEEFEKNYFTKRNYSIKEIVKVSNNKIAITSD
ncbi:MAG: hypothetical protein A2Y15_02945 [Clostridiales bacterium GWF2_36_10]|nr:MAG: hypothetical protein A2Y15_02945 [Clostridiales bacterium GWF2_36_10]HAN20932.1 GGDEF-domain containing protein [Clostridiales bacterium]